MLPRSLLIAALLTVGTAAADPLPTCHLPDAVAATCVHVDTAATAGQWVLWHLPNQTPVRGRTYPVADGGPVVGMDPAYRWLLGIRVEPPEIDSRLQVIAYPCPEAADLVAGTLTATCVASVRPAGELKGAAENAAAARIDAAVQALGIRNPADLIRAVSLLEQSRRGQALTPDQSAWLAALGGAGIDYVDQVRAVQADIDAWIEAHPGQIPDIGPAVWPPLPSLGAGQ